MKYLLLFAIHLFLVTALWAGVRCSVCNKNIKGKYVKNSKGVAFCNRKCLKQVLPKCTKCSKTIQGKYKILEKKPYCSVTCLNTALPKCHRCKSPFTGGVKLQGLSFCKQCMSQPKCFSCSLPNVKGVKITDGRVFCKKCHEKAIFNKSEAKKLFKRAVVEHFKISGKA